MHGELLRLFGLQIHHAAHLGRGGGHHAQFRFVRAALHREGDAAPGGKVRGIGELQRLPVLRHGAEAVQQRTARPLQAAVTPVPMLYRSSRVDTRRLCR